ncbi:MAG: recombinase family protein [Xanthobacteraceae bacterium]|nr:recombinase family protein [Xanthobacteraceae bacterium]MCW5678240.1 recombinase family protein [Xanthobacteraceae bacterium]
MKPSPKKQLRCAVYTRKSTDHNLELEFNSLDAQREACEAYIKSQAHEGWRLIPTKYDDGGHSGASLERPALQKLLEDVRASKIDVIVVYKIDRLTRSLTDFAKLVEVFDQQSVSFVSITQSFNTTTSMGRLTLNVLLSFAQFEREVIGERVRDKIAASKKKGIWVGGPIPLGYRSVDKKLVVVPEEAKLVRMIFDRYLELRSIGALIEDLDRRGVKTKRQILATGKHRGGCRFGKGTLRYLLTRRFYVGDVEYKGSINKGEHDTIIERKTFDAVQKLLSTNAVERKTIRQSTNALLSGLLFDDAGNRMTATYSTKKGVRYRYYISHSLLQSRKMEAGSVSRVPATDIESEVIAVLKREKLISRTVTDLCPSALRQVVERITVLKEELKIETVDKSIGRNGVLFILWEKSSTSSLKGVAHAPTNSAEISWETRQTLLTAIARARSWMNDLESGSVSSIHEIADREGNVERHIRLLLPLAFTPPAIISALIDGYISTNTTVTGLAKNRMLKWYAPETY